MSNQWSRRDLGRGLAIGVATALGSRRSWEPMGASDWPSLDAEPGRQCSGQFLAQPEVDPVAVCDVYQPFLDKGIELSGGRAKPYRDSPPSGEQGRRCGAGGDPDHWHALQTVGACQAGGRLSSKSRCPCSSRRGGHAGGSSPGQADRSTGAGSAPARLAAPSSWCGRVPRRHAPRERRVHPQRGGGFKPKELPVDASNLDWDLWLGRPRNGLRSLPVPVNCRWF